MTNLAGPLSLTEDDLTKDDKCNFSLARALADTESALQREQIQRIQPGDEANFVFVGILFQIWPVSDHVLSLSMVSVQIVAYDS